MTSMQIPFMNAPALKNIALLFEQSATAFPSIVMLMLIVVGAAVPHRINPKAIVKGAGELFEYMWSSEGTLLINMTTELIITKTQNSISFQTLTRSASTPTTKDITIDANCVIKKYKDSSLSM